MYSPEQENISTTASTKVPVKYGELIVLGTQYSEWVHFRNLIGQRHVPHRTARCITLAAVQADTVVAAFSLVLKKAFQTLQMQSL
ncbi:hypothetical protein PAMP_001388 [Pampus punctatissimus]